MATHKTPKTKKINKSKTFIKNRTLVKHFLVNKFSIARMSVFIVVFAAIGSALLILTHAATPTKWEIDAQRDNCPLGAFDIPKPAIYQGNSYPINSAAGGCTRLLKRLIAYKTTYSGSIKTIDTVFGPALTLAIKGIKRDFNDLDSLRQYDGNVDSHFWVIAMYIANTGYTPGVASAPTGSPYGCNSNRYSALVDSNASFAGTDQGIDFVPANSTGFYICAPGPGTITLADQTGHTFNRTPGTAEIIEHLDRPPNAPSSSSYIYYAEIIQINSSIHVGVHVNKGNIIGHNAQSPGIEVGWAPSATKGFMCGIGGATSCGTSFGNWITIISAGGAP
jgi:hypothetical protein